MLLLGRDWIIPVEIRHTLTPLLMFCYFHDQTTREFPPRVLIVCLMSCLSIGGQQLCSVAPAPVFRCRLQDAPRFWISSALAGSRTPARQRWIGNMRLHSG